MTNYRGMFDLDTLKPIPYTTMIVQNCKGQKETFDFEAGMTLQLWTCETYKMACKRGVLYKKLKNGQIVKLHEDRNE